MRARRVCLVSVFPPARVPEMDADGWTDGRAVRKAVFSMIATKRMSTLAGFSPRAQALGADIQQFKEESEKEHMDEVRGPPSLPLRVFVRC